MQRTRMVRRFRGWTCGAEVQSRFENSQGLPGFVRGWIHRNPHGTSTKFIGHSSKGLLLP